LPRVSIALNGALRLALAILLLEVWVDSIAAQSSGPPVVAQSHGSHSRAGPPQDRP
jgi:hypothetical protein